MQLLVEVAVVSLPLFGAIMLAVQFGALSLGTVLGRRKARRIEAGADPVEGVGLIVGALLGLLAFTLGMVVSIAEARFEDRRRIALQEANAIGTAWLRAQAIGHPRGEEIARLLEGYTATRIAWLSASHDAPALDAATAETSRVQTLAWGHAAAIARERRDPQAAALMAALNDTFDLATTQRWAFLGQLPAELPWMLIGLTVLSVGGIGYQWGLKRRWHPVLALMLLAGWSGSLVLIADLSNPRIGWVRVDTSPYVWTLQGFAGGMPIPPPP